MKAVVYHRYGLAGVLQLEDIPKPTPSDDEVLVRVRAASVNPYDWHLMEGKPFLIRLFGLGLLKPKDTRFGADVAGLVEAVGKNVAGFKPGDEVFGVCRGSCSEYACVTQSKLAKKPHNVTLAQAACGGIAAITALQGLRDKGRVQPGQKVLINGAAGGVGTFAVQIAKAFGAEVTGVCSSRNADMVRSLGADQVIDYTQQDFTKAGHSYDVIFDLIANHSLSQFGRLLNPEGIYVGAGIGPGGSIVGFLGRAMVTAPLMSRFGSHKFIILMAKITPEDLGVMGNLMDSGKVRAVIDRRYQLSDVPEAIRYLATGHARAKLVIRVGGAADHDSNG
ncbi:MAG TPA: NAD(P)-dependent alcohol dehydrogenase [Terriglobales bacterium]|nr:NAD(P)-dependent alcohol dehydrogenase [Terriglobales bacterium]